MASMVWCELKLVLLLEVELCPPAGCAAPEEAEIAPLELLVVRLGSEDFGGFDFLGEGFGANGSVWDRIGGVFVVLDEAELNHCSGVPRLGEPLRSRCGRVSAAGGGEVHGMGDGADASCGGGVFVFGGALAWSEVDRR